MGFFIALFKDRDGRINRKEIKDILNQLLIMEGFEKGI